MRLEHLPDAPWLAVDATSFRTPWHRVSLIAGGRTAEGWLMSALDAAPADQRSTLVIKRPEEIVCVPRSISEGWRSFSADLAELQRRWGTGNVATLKRAQRMYEAGQILQDYDLEPFAHRHGAVFGQLTARNGPFRIAFMPDQLTRGARGYSYRDEELEEVLLSHERFLPQLLVSYYENIGYYLDSIFLGAGDVRSTKFCRRIREINLTSIRGKLTDIDRADRRFPAANRVAERIKERYAKELDEARVVDSFSHLLVNYVYLYSCIGDRVDEYHRRLDELADGPSSNEAVGFLKRCADHIRRPDDAFVHEVDHKPDERPAWLHRLAISGVLVGEVARFVADGPVDRPGVFLTHHFEVKDSESFRIALEASTTASSKPVSLILGRKLAPNLRWSLLARIWFSDFQVLYLPASWDTVTGEKKELEPRKSWVMAELLYGHRLDHPLVVITRNPADSRAISRFTDHVEGYTNKREIRAIPAAGWDEFCTAAKESIVEQIVSEEYVLADVSNIEAFVLNEFEHRVREPAARHLIRLLFESWRSFHAAEEWSIAQAIISMCLGSGAGKDPTLALNARWSVRPVAAWIRRNTSDPRFTWARARSENEVAAAIGRYLSRDEGTKGLASFAFRVRSVMTNPIAITRPGRRTIHFRLGLFYYQLCAAFAISPIPDELKRLAENVARYRPD